MLKRGLLDSPELWTTNLYSQTNSQEGTWIEICWWTLWISKVRETTLLHLTKATHFKLSVLLTACVKHTAFTACETAVLMFIFAPDALHWFIQHCQSEHKTTWNDFQFHLSLDILIFKADRKLLTVWLSCCTVQTLNNRQWCVLKQGTWPSDTWLYLDGPLQLYVFMGYSSLEYQFYCWAKQAYIIREIQHCHVISTFSTSHKCEN